MSSKPFAWPYSLSISLCLMAPFDILASLAMDIYLPVVPAMPGALNTSPAVVQLTLSLYMVMLGVGQLVFGPISDRFGRRPVLLGGVLLFASTSFCLAGASSGAVFLLLRFLQAAGASAALVATFATVRDVYADRSESVVIYSLFSAMLAFVPALGPIAGALVADNFGWRPIFVTLGTLAALAMVNAGLFWRETRPAAAMSVSRLSPLPVLRSFSFWTYTLGFSAAMGTFFVFFSTAPRLLIDRAGYSELAFSLAFATAAVVMIATTRFARKLVQLWGTSGSLLRGMLMLLAGALLLSIGEAFAPSFTTVILPMWVMSIGIVLAASVTANGALKGFDDIAGSAVALYFCIQSLFVGVVGTLAVVLLGGDTVWPLTTYAAIMALIVLSALRIRGWRD